MTLEPELVERFRSDLSALWLDANEPNVKFGIALSAGPDSLALLLLAHAALPGKVEAATVDHGLRTESAAEAEYAADICATLRVPHEILRVEVAEGNLQTQARLARYAVLAKWSERRAIDTLCTAHHRDDQVETLFMRLNRGSGLSGLAGVRAAGLVPGSEIILLRPLLGWDRATLERVVEQSGFNAVQDPSNKDLAYDRVRIREALAAAHWIDRKSVARSAKVLAEMEDSILGLAAEDYEFAGSRDGEIKSYRPFERSQIYRPSIWAEIIVMIFRDFDRSISRADAARMAENLIDEVPLNMGGIHASFRYEDDEIVWDFTPENPRRTG